MEKTCSTCIHNGYLTMDDVACCNCCEDHEFYEPIDDKENK